MAESPKPHNAVFVLHDAPIAFLDYAIDTVQVGLAESHAITTDKPWRVPIDLTHAPAACRRGGALVCAERGAVTGAIKTYTYAR